MAAGITITRGFAPGAIGRVVELHGRYYAEQWGFDPCFEAEVATELAQFSSSYDPDKDGFWLAWQDGQIMASVTLDHTGDDSGAARVRWFVADPALQGTGAGRQLLDALLDFAAESGYRHICLWTFEGLAAARALYDRAGFVVTEEVFSDDWGPRIKAQRMDLRL